jgi:hypothetical protein
MRAARNYDDQVQAVVTPPVSGVVTNAPHAAMGRPALGQLLEGVTSVFASKGNRLSFWWGELAVAT